LRAVGTIAWRDIHSFFVSPLAYVVLTAWLFFQGLQLYFLAVYFADQPYAAGDATQTPLTMFFGGSSLFYLALLVIVPLLTMRLVAEEAESGRLETLLTAPIAEWQIVLGKYLAALVFWIALWLPSVLFVWIILQFGSVDGGVVLSSYLGVLGIGVYYMAIGLLMSTIARRQLIAGVLTFMALGSLFILGLGSFIFPDSGAKAIFDYINIWTHMESFSRGIVDSRFLVFDGTVAALAVLLAVRMLESRRLAT
jgi:ABC-2 type transport system permease protein